MKMKERVIIWYRSPEISKFHYLRDNDNFSWGENPYIYLKMSLREYNFIVNNINQKPSIIKMKMSNVKNIPVKTYSNTSKRSMEKAYLML